MPTHRPWLLVVAAPKEARALADAMGGEDIPSIWRVTEYAIVGRPRACMVRSGVGKWAAAGAVARWYNADRFAGVLSIGICGSFAARTGEHPPLGSLLLADPSVLADEGVRTPSGFLGLDAIGFGEDASPVRPDGASHRALAPLADSVGTIATVSACSGTDASARAVVSRTGAIGEAMEGAACGLATRRINPDARFAELRVVSNTTGDRDSQVWDLAGALERMRTVLGPVLDALNA
jgi:futalosine hydrolase